MMRATFVVLGSFGSRNGNAWPRSSFVDLKQVAHHSSDFVGAPATLWWRNEGLVIMWLHVFPQPTNACATENDFAQMRAGLSGQDLLMTARLVSSGKANLESWSAQPDADLREICARCPVWNEVANCVMLFAYERLRAVPIDVWIERVLKQQVFSAKKEVTKLSGCAEFRKRIWRTRRLRAAILVSSRAIASRKIASQPVLASRLPACRARSR